MSQLISTILVILMALAVAAHESVRYARCEVPMFEQCATDSQCECLWGVED